MSRRRHLSAPEQVFLFVTEACNFRCRYCSIRTPDGPSLQELALPEFKDLFEQFDRMHVLVVSFFGGEPLLRPDIAELLRLVRPHAFFRNLNTNGSLVTDAIARELVASRFSWVNVSLDGPRRTHETLCGVPGSFEKVTHGIETLVRHGLRVGIECVLNRKTLGTIPEVLRIARKLGAQFLRILPMGLIGGACDSCGDDALSWEEWREFFCELTRKKLERSLPFNEIGINFFNCNFCPWEMYYALPPRARRRQLKAAWGIDLERAPAAPGGLHCGAGTERCAIRANGDVSPCDHLIHFEQLKAGSIRRQALATIWSNARVFRELRRITRRDMIGPCRDCGNRWCSGEDPAVRLQATGSLLTSEGRCLGARGVTS